MWQWEERRSLMLGSRQERRLGAAALGIRGGPDSRISVDGQGARGPVPRRPTFFSRLLQRATHRRDRRVRGAQPNKG
jgi:hypothetical protein